MDLEPGVRNRAVKQAVMSVGLPAPPHAIGIDSPSSFRKHASSPAVTPVHLDQATASAAKYEQLQRLLNHQRQTGEAFAHIGVARGQPDLQTSRNRDRRSPSRQLRIPPSGSVSMWLSTRARRPQISSIVHCAYDEDGTWWVVPAEQGRVSKRPRTCSPAPKPPCQTLAPQSGKALCANRTRAEIDTGHKQSRRSPRLPEASSDDALFLFA